MASNLEEMGIGICTQILGVMSIRRPDIIPYNFKLAYLTKGKKVFNYSSKVSISTLNQ